MSVKISMVALGCTVAVAGLTVFDGHIARADQTGLASMHDQRREGRKVCMSSHFHSGTGQGRTKKAAKAAAIKAWQEFTAFEYGLDWAYYRRAASRGLRYDRTASGWEAYVEARPCRRR